MGATLQSVGAKLIKCGWYTKQSVGATLQRVGVTLIKCGCLTNKVWGPHYKVWVPHK